MKLYLYFFISKVRTRFIKNAISSASECVVGNLEAVSFGIVVSGLVVVEIVVDWVVEVVGTGVVEIVVDWVVGRLVVVVTLRIVAVVAP